MELIPPSYLLILVIFADFDLFQAQGPVLDYTTSI